MTDTTASVRHQEAVEALTAWQKTNKQRMEMTPQLKNVPEDERVALMTSYMQLAEIELVQAGAAILALTECLTAFNTICEERTGSPILSDPSGT